MSVYKIKEVRVLTVREENSQEMPILREPVDVARFWREHIATGALFDSEREHFITINLNTRRRVTSWSTITTGTATASLAHPREVFRSAVINGACAVIVMHNHPSGDPEPSSADVGITRQLKEAARVLGIELTEHLIMGDPKADPSGRGYFSFRLAGLL